MNATTWQVFAKHPERGEWAKPCQVWG